MSRVSSDMPAMTKASRCEPAMLKAANGQGETRYDHGTRIDPRLWSRCFKLAGYEKRRGSMYDQSLVDTFNSAPPTRELASRGV